MFSTGTGITSRCKITTGVCLKQLDSWLSDFSGKHLYQMALSEPSVCLTCYLPHTQQPAPVKIKWSLTAYHTSCFSDPNRSAPLTQYHTTVSMQSMILKAYYTADMLTFPWTQYTAFLSHPAQLKNKSYRRFSEFGGLYFYHPFHSNLSVIK